MGLLEFLNQKFEFHLSRHYPAKGGDSSRGRLGPSTVHLCLSTRI